MGPTFASAPAINPAPICKTPLDGDAGIMDGIMAFVPDSRLPGQKPFRQGKGCFTVTSWPSARLT